MEGDVPEERGEDRSVGRAYVRLGIHLAVKHAHLQACANEPHERPIGDPLLNHLLQLGAIHAVKVRDDVRLHDPVHFTTMPRSGQSPKRVMRTTLRSKPIRAIEKLRLVDGFQHVP